MKSQLLLEYGFEHLRWVDVVARVQQGIANIEGATLPPAPCFLWDVLILSLMLFQLRSCTLTPRSMNIFRAHCVSLALRVALLRTGLGDGGGLVMLACLPFRTHWEFNVVMRG